MPQAKLIASTVMDGQFGYSGVESVVSRLGDVGIYRYLCYTATDDMLFKYWHVSNLAHYLGPVSVVTESVLLSFVEGKSRVLVNPKARVVTEDGDLAFYKWRSESVLSSSQLCSLWCYDPLLEFCDSDVHVLVVGRGGCDREECSSCVPSEVLSELNITQGYYGDSILVVSPYALIERTLGRHITYDTERVEDVDGLHAFSFSMDRLLMAAKNVTASEIIVTRSWLNPDILTTIRDVTGLKVSSV